MLWRSMRCREHRRQRWQARNLKPAKDKSTERIDGIVAAIMAIGRALVVQEEEPEYTQRGGPKPAPLRVAPWRVRMLS